MQTLIDEYRGAYLNALGKRFASGFSSESVYLWTLPMFFCNGWCCTWGITAVGGTQVCLREIDPGVFSNLINSRIPIQISFLRGEGEILLQQLP